MTIRPADSSVQRLEVDRCQNSRSPDGSMVDLVGAAIAEADGADVQANPERYRRLARAAMKPIAKPTEGMVDAAHAAVEFDDHWAINSRRDFRRAVKAMILAAINEQSE